ncbi:MAG: nuclear transport factor 2 family protein [Pseudomonadota bacterium]|nr:nuclear transport factor 2 family protein [Pseudomonadota bacterium]
MKTPEQIVQAQLDAYNARDVERLLAIYADDAQFFEHPSTLLFAGSEQLRARFVERFAEPDLYARLLHRTVLGNRVIDHEAITRNFVDGRGTLQVAMVYEVADQRIARAWCITGERALEEPHHS